jgi:hypothetical protein
MGCPTLGLSQASRLSQGEGGGQSPRKGWEEEGPQLLPWEPSPKPPGPVTDSGSPFPDPGEDWKAWLPPRSGSKVTSASRQPSTPPGIPSQKDFLQMLGVPQWSPPYLGIVSIQEHTDRRAGDYSPVHSHSHPTHLASQVVPTCPHMLTLLGAFTLTHILSQTPVLTHASKANSHSSLIITHSHQDPTLTNRQTVERSYTQSLTPDTPPPSCPSMPSLSHTGGRGSTSLHPGPACSLIIPLLQSRPPPGRPAPQPAHTYGKLPKVASLPSPSPAGDFYQVIRK